jgi:hypothetical protein
VIYFRSYSAELEEIVRSIVGTTSLSPSQIKNFLSTSGLLDSISDNVINALADKPISNVLLNAPKISHVQNTHSAHTNAPLTPRTCHNTSPVEESKIQKSNPHKYHISIHLASGKAFLDHKDVHEVCIRFTFLNYLLFKGSEFFAFCSFKMDLTSIQLY